MSATFSWLNSHKSQLIFKARKLDLMKNVAIFGKNDQPHPSTISSSLISLQHNTSSSLVKWKATQKFLLGPLSWWSNTRSPGKPDGPLLHPLQDLPQLSLELSPPLSYKIMNIGTVPCSLQIIVPNIPPYILIQMILVWGLPLLMSRNSVLRILVFSPFLPPWDPK